MIDWQSLGVISVGLLSAGVVKGATGIGFATCALPILSHFVGLKPAMALILAPTFATNFSVAISSGSVKASLVKFAPLYLAMLPGIAVGIALLAWISSSFATMILGLTIVGYTIFSIASPKVRLSLRVTHLLRFPVGFITGILTGMTGSQVVPLVPYMFAVEMEAEQTIQSINLGVLVLTTCLGVGLLASNLVDPAQIGISVLAVVPALLGTEIGNRLRSHLPLAVVRRLVLAVVGVIGVKMIFWN